MNESLIITPFADMPSSALLMTDGYFGGSVNGIAYRLGYNSSISVPVYIGAVLDTTSNKYSSAFIGFTTSNILVYYNEAYNSATVVKTFTLNTPWSISGNPYKFGMLYNIPSDFPSYIPKFDNRDDMAEYFLNYTPEIFYPITYRPTNCSFPGAPAEAAVGEIVVVPVIFPDGYGLVNESNIYVTNNGVVIPSTYSNGQLTFTMPDPS